MRRAPSTFILTTVLALGLTSCAQEASEPDGAELTPASSEAGSAETTSEETDSGASSESSESSGEGSSERPTGKRNPAAYGELTDAHKGKMYTASLPSSKGISDCAEPIEKIDMLIEFADDGQTATITSDMIGAEVDLELWKGSSYWIVEPAKCQKPDRAKSTQETKYKNPADPNDNRGPNGWDSGEEEKVYIIFRAYDDGGISVDMEREDGSAMQSSHGKPI